MNKFLPAFIAAVIASAGVSQAGVGYFGNAYIVLNLGSGDSFRQITSPANSLTNAGGGFNLTPDGVNSAFSGNLGEFDISGSPTFQLKGFEWNTYNDSGDTVTNAVLNYRITKVGDTPGSFSSISLGSPTSTSGNDRFWQLTSGGVNLLSGLSNGNYTITTYIQATATFTGGGGGSFTMANWGTSSGPTASFSLIPEPTTWALLAGSLAITTIFRRRRRA